MQEGGLLAGFHTFGRHRHVEGGGKRHRRLQHRAALYGLPACHGERPIDLHAIEAKADEVTDAGEAGAEIIERDAHAARLQPVHDEFRTAGILDEIALRYLQRDPGWLNARSLDDRERLIREVGIAELRRRDVDRNADLRPVARRLAGAAKHERAERIDDAGRL
jgi:hypothetical protein